MWCPTCKSEYREGISRCSTCDINLVAEDPSESDTSERGPLTGRLMEDELETTGPALAGTFVTMEEAQAALRALSDAGVQSEIVNRDEQFPMNISRYEPAFGVSVAGVDSPQARHILAVRGLLPTSVARFHTENDAQAALSALEARSLKGRISVLVLDEIPEDFRKDLDPYIIEVPAEQEAAAMEALREFGIRTCEACGAQIQKADAACRACGEVIPA